MLVGGQDAWRMASQLKESDTPVIITLSTALPSRRDDGYDSTFGNAAKLHEAGVRFCMAMNGRNSEARTSATCPTKPPWLRLWLAERGSSQSRYSLSRAAFGYRRSVGILANRKGRHPHRDHRRPARFPTQVEAAYIDGRKIDLTNRQTRLRDKYKEKYRRK